MFPSLIADNVSGIQNNVSSEGRSDRKMFDAKNQDVVCPRCGHREVHFDCKIGFYCMACGCKFSAEEARAFVEQQVLQNGTENCS